MRRLTTLLALLVTTAGVLLPAQAAAALPADYTTGWDTTGCTLMLEPAGPRRMLATHTGDCGKLRAVVTVAGTDSLVSLRRAIRADGTFRVPRHWVSIEVASSTGASVGIMPARND